MAADFHMSGQARNDDIEPLEPAMWFERWRWLSGQDYEQAEFLERSLRHGFHLIQLTPGPLKHVFRCARLEDEFEQLLEARAYVSAALSLISSSVGYQIRSLDPDRSEATVSARHVPKEFKASGSTAESALLRAWLKYLDWLGSDFEKAVSPSRHKLQSLPRGQETQH